METEHYVGPGAVCFYEDPQSGEWHEAVFHKWVGPGFSPMAIVHDKKTGECFMITMGAIRFRKP